MLTDKQLRHTAITSSNYKVFDLNCWAQTKGLPLSPHFLTSFIKLLVGEPRLKKAFPSIFMYSKVNLFFLGIKN